MDWKDLDKEIERLETMAADARSFLNSGRQDWRPLFDKAKEIQAGFNSRPMFPTKQERDLAWNRFNEARSQIHQRADQQRTEFRETSERRRNEIIDIAESARFHSLTDKLLFFFDPTTVREMKQMGETLKKAGRVLSENKFAMAKEHKDQCFAIILSVRQSHEMFWHSYSEHRATKQKESDEKRKNFIDRKRANMRANHEKLEKALTAYNRVETNLASNLEKLNSARSPEFVSRVSDWIAEDRDKLARISESIERIRSWIREDEDRLNDALNH